MTEEIYIYDNTEVIKTGRIAVKQAKVKSRRSDRSPGKGDTLYEIKPADSEEGSWTRWVRQADLYEIIEQKEDNNNDNDGEIPRQGLLKIDDEDFA